MKPVWVVKQIPVLIAAMALGILVSLQRSADITSTTTASGPVRQTVRQLELEQESLKRTVGRLRERLNARQSRAAASTEMLEGLRAELTVQKMRAGLVAVRGPGVEVVLNDSRRAPGGTSANDLLIHDFDVRDAIGVLWLSGAEAIAVNGERLVNSSSVSCVGSTIMLNDTRLSPPYRIRAIGEPALMLDHLHNPGYLGDLKDRSEQHGLRVEFAAVETVTISAHRGSLPRRYAQPGG